jgi:hypothetical protein
MHQLLVQRADRSIGCTDGAVDREELLNPMQPCAGPKEKSMAGKDSGNQDWLREHWRGRRERFLSELRGMEAGLRVLPDTPEGAEVREILEAKATALRTEIEELDSYLGVWDPGCKVSESKG